MTPWRPIRMPKTASSSVAEWLTAEGLPTARGHEPASEAEPGSRLWGTLRSPLSWYASWYGHVMCSLSVPGPRAAFEAAAMGSAENSTRLSLEYYGGGSLEFRDILYGLTHLDELSGDLIGTHTMLNVPGDLGGYWSRNVRYYFGGPEGWLVDRLLNFGTLEQGMEELYGRKVCLPRVGVGKGPVASLTPEMKSWVWAADGDVWRAGLAKLGER